MGAGPRAARWSRKLEAGHQPLHGADCDAVPGGTGIPGKRGNVAVGRFYRRWVKQVFDEAGIDLDPPNDVVIRYWDAASGRNG